MPDSPNFRRPRWGLLFLILLATAGAIVWRQLSEESNQQQANMESTLYGMIGLLAGTLWLLLLSNLAWAARGLGFVLLLGAIGGFFGLFRIVGVDGNLIPVFAWRFTEELAPPTAADAPSDSARQDGPDARFAQFFGNARDGRVTGTSLDAEVLTEVWRQPVGLGWSGFAIAGRQAITQEQRGDQELVVCYDLLDGSVWWSHGDTARYDNVLAGVGPRATPTIVDDRVYAMGATGLLTCLELGDGKLLWQVDTLDGDATAIPEWGVACSPLVHGDKVWVTARGDQHRSLVAYAADSGAELHAAGDSPVHWSSPVVAELAGREQILVFQDDLVAHDPTDGSVLWSYSWKKQHPHVALPVVLPGSGGDILVSSGYGTGSERIQVTGTGDGFQVQSLWQTRRFKSKFANVVVHDGHAYGFDDGILACIDLSDGSRAWKKGRYGHGQLLLCGDRLLVMAESGEVIFVAADSTGHREFLRFQGLEGKTWNPPALAGSYLLVRNDSEAACFRFPAPSQPR